MRDEEIYVFIGRRLRARRRMLGLTQGTVAAGCGLTFQQIQKYEAGMTAIPAARLVVLSKVLGVSISEIFDGLQSNGEDHGPRDAWRWNGSDGHEIRR